MTQCYRGEVDHLAPLGAYRHIDGLEQAGRNQNSLDKLALFCVLWKNQYGESLGQEKARRARRLVFIPLRLLHAVLCRLCRVRSGLPVVSVEALPAGKPIKS